jgi:hypothetical protein
VTSVQYIAHRTNLVVQTLNGLNLVKKLNWATFSMYNYFVHSLKHHLEVNKLIKLLECKGNKLLKNITTWWISIFSPSNFFLNEYKPLIVKVAQDTATINTTKVNHELLCDVETLLGFTCIFPLLEIVQGFSKFAQPRCAIFIHDCVSIIKLAKVDLQTMYCDPNFRSSYYLISPSSMMLLNMPMKLLFDMVDTSWNPNWLHCLLF